MIMFLYARLARAVALSILLVAATASAQADKLTEANMTQKDYDDITASETSIPGQVKAEPPFPVHDFSDANEKAVKDAHGVRLIKGKEWRKLSPTERDKTMRDFYKTMKPSTFYVLEVPSGNLWAIDMDEYFKLKKSGEIRRWAYGEKEKLPKAVKANSGNGQEDRRNDGPIKLGTSFEF